MPRSPSEKVLALSLATFDGGISDGHITRCSRRVGWRRFSAYVGEVRDLARLALRWR